MERPPEARTGNPDAAEVSGDGLDAEDPALLPMGALLRRSALRGLVIGSALAAVQIVVVVVLVVVGLVLDPREFPQVAPRVLGGGVLGAAVWLVAAVPIAPLAFVEQVAAARSRSEAGRIKAAALTLPLAYATLLVLVTQCVYAWHVLADGQPPTAALRRTVGLLGGTPLRSWLGLLVAVWPLVVSVPLTTYTRLSGFSHRAQLGVSLVGTAMSSLCVVILGNLLVDALVPRGAGTITINFLAPLGCANCVVGLFVATLLPGAYQRADEFEAWLLRRWGD